VPPPDELDELLDEDELLELDEDELLDEELEEELELLLDELPVPYTSNS
jgi:hypothetical protein